MDELHARGTLQRQHGEMVVRADARCAVGDCLRPAPRILDQIGARPDGSMRVVVLDVRQAEAIGFRGEKIERLIHPASRGLGRPA